ncbi:MAG: phytanoyl-CoA dioxygenase family protein [Candidatus Azotimanducaceae bacterium]|uniref:Phytanoyl-CoA dioxygenase family protein n=1 Tax=OM182 bacterium TaxID=2510334 RepID=A0A520RZX7_9GAMM|nr:hypothetical protein [Gammaproteobacteria bacterium]RZO75776.1 MAG: hypothetical protein EVA68_06175 [OM182 bacterium]
MTTAMDRVMDTIAKLDLKSHIAELEVKGFTALPGVLSKTQIESSKRAIIARVEEKSGKPVDLITGKGFEGGWRYVPHLLYDDEVFEDILMAPKPLALLTYLLGESCLLSSVGCHFKGQGGEPLLLHSDNANGIPQPFPSYAQIANINYALTPYSKREGALVMVPGSHRHGRHPTPAETQLSGDNTNPDAVAMDLAPGDCVIWHGNTWHGSFAREIPGIRMNLAMYCCRQYIQTQEFHPGNVPQDMLNRHTNDERFQVLLGAKMPYPWDKTGPKSGLLSKSPRGLFD